MNKGGNTGRKEKRRMFRLKQRRKWEGKEEEMGHLKEIDENRGHFGRGEGSVTSKYVHAHSTVCLYN